MRDELDIVTDVVETHTYDYHLYVDTCNYDDWGPELLDLFPWFVDDGFDYKGHWFVDDGFDYQGHWFMCDITYVDVEDRQAIQAFIGEHQLSYDVQKITRAVDD